MSAEMEQLFPVIWVSYRHWKRLLPNNYPCNAPFSCPSHTTLLSPDIKSSYMKLPEDSDYFFHISV